MSCNVASCSGKHQGTHFKIRSSADIMEFDLIVTAQNYSLQFRHFTLAFGKVADLLNHSLFHRQLPDDAGDLAWNSDHRCWSVCFRGGIYRLENLDEVLVAGSEMYQTKRPGRKGVSSVTIDGVPIKERYEYTGTDLRLIPGGK